MFCPLLPTSSTTTLLLSWPWLALQTQALWKVYCLVHFQPFFLSVETEAARAHKVL